MGYHTCPARVLTFPGRWGPILKTNLQNRTRLISTNVILFTGAIKKGAWTGIRRPPISSSWPSGYRFLNII